MVIDIGWSPGPGTWAGNSPAGQAIGLLANGRSRRAAASAAGISISGLQKWIDRGKGALEAAKLNPEVAYADQRERIPFYVRCYADFVVQADVAYMAADRQLENKLWANTLASTNPADQLKLLARRNPDEWGEAPVEQTVNVNVNHPAANLLDDPSTRGMAIALAEAMALAAADKMAAIEATSTEVEP